MRAKECWECGATTEEIHDHHVIPRSRGGIRTVPICGLCHAKAHHRNKNMSTSALIKAAYQTMKASNPNLRWGDPNMATNAQPIGVKVRKENASKFNKKIQHIVYDLKLAGYSDLKILVDKLNQLGIMTRRGNTFTVRNLSRVLTYEVNHNIKESEE